ncbi:MAG: hypothetical protein JO033_29505 [Acidobacteriaceae bacterium]|nr:hypothetical protein [Acidobacteriaceae bacterium]
MNTFVLLLFAGWLGLPQATNPPTELSAEEIMQRVATNQDRGQTERNQYVYEQHIRVDIRRINGKLAREEKADLLVLPAAKGNTKKTESLKGRYWKKGHYIDFTGDPAPDSGGLDGSLAKSFREDLINDDSKDGIGKDLFPLTTNEQKDLKFTLEGETVVAGRPAYRIAFGPADKNDYTWAGEALIDKEDFQPVSVYTRLSRKLPLFVRTMLGTDLPGLGFTTQYKRVEPGVWFPVSFGTEFRLHAVFFINRIITVSMESTSFKHTSADSKIEYLDTHEAAPKPNQ